MSVAVNGKGSGFEAGGVKALFEVPTIGARSFYDVSSDGQRFLISTLPGQALSAPITVVLNWTDSQGK